MTCRLFIAAAAQLAASLAEQFEALGGYEVRLAAPGKAFRPPWPDAVLLDAACCDAEAMARRLRRSGFRGKILVIAAAAGAPREGNAADEVDAMLSRPFRFADLVARLEAPRARPRAPGGFGARLTEKETAILERLAQGKGAVIPKAALLADVWGYGPNVSTRTLETHIHRLRRKIEADPGRPRRVLTESGGYRLADVNQDGGDALTAP